MRRKPIVGETLILWTPPHRFGKENAEVVTVKSVGSKYFSLHDYTRARFCISDWGIEDVCNTRANSPKWIFESEAELEQHKADLEIQKRFGEWLRSYPRVTVEQAKDILAIVEPQSPTP